MSFDLKIQNRDLIIGSDGDLQKVTDTDKLVQDILKLALTELGANPFFPWYGSPLGSNAIGNVMDFELISAISRDQLRQSLQMIQNLQSQQVRLGQQVSAAEQLAAIKSIEIRRHMTDPRIYRVDIEAMSKALTPISTSFNMSL